MNGLRVGHNGEDQEMDCVADGEAGMISCADVDVNGTGRKPAIEMASSLHRAIRRDPNPNGRWKRALLSEDGTELLIDTADGRTFIARIREV